MEIDLVLARGVFVEIPGRDGEASRDRLRARFADDRMRVLRRETLVVVVRVPVRDAIAGVVSPDVHFRFTRNGLVRPIRHRDHAGAEIHARRGNVRGRSP
jgi:hypothetical protein